MEAGRSAGNYVVGPGQLFIPIDGKWIEVAKVKNLTITPQEKPMTATLEDVKYAVLNVLYHPELGFDVAKDILDHVSLGRAKKVLDLYRHEWPAVVAMCESMVEPAIRRKRDLMPPMKIAMMLHFATKREPFAPEAQRTSPAYTTFIKELLRDGMVERPTKAQRREWAGWAYKATPKGQCYVKALGTVPMPVRTDPQWAMPPLTTGEETP